jgi:hypothetical protein
MEEPMLTAEERMELGNIRRQAARLARARLNDEEGERLDSSARINPKCLSEPPQYRDTRGNRRSFN